MVALLVTDHADRVRATRSAAVCHSTARQPQRRHLDTGLGRHSPAMTPARMSTPSAMACSLTVA
jgi:hypothetical protein